MSIKNEICEENVKDCDKDNFGTGVCEFCLGQGWVLKMGQTFRGQGGGGGGLPLHPDPCLSRGLLSTVAG